MRDELNDRECTDEMELGRLNEGLLSYEETRMLNRHLWKCSECKQKYRNIATSYSGKPSGSQESILTDFFNRYRRVAGMERDISLPEPIEMPETELDRMLADLGSADPGHFLVSHGKLESLLDGLKENVEKLGADPTLTPEGEKNFVSFLARCVVENVEEMASGSEELETSMFAELFARLGHVADGSVIGMEDIALFREAGEAYEEKVGNMLAKYRKGSMGA